MKKLLLVYFLALISTPVIAQTSFGIETQAYPAGLVPGIRVDLGLINNFTITSRIGYNFTDRRDWGEHDNEEGGGPGLSLGIERRGFLTENLSVHARADLWFMEIDWRDLYSGPALCGATPCPDETGETSITVFQPTIGLGYTIPFSNSYFIKPSLSFGYEINVKTEGVDVGQGAILLVGFQLGRFLK
ncbi:MAG: hypothetical protein ACMZ7B_04990 [Balneola sp.]